MEALELLAFLFFSVTLIGFIEAAAAARHWKKAANRWRADSDYWFDLYHRLCEDLNEPARN